MDLAKLIKPQWVFRSETAGEWDVYFYSVKAALQVEKWSSGEISDPVDAVRALIGVMCKTHTDNHEDEASTTTEPTADDLAAFTEADINSFSRQFLEHDESLGAETSLEKTEGQSDAEFFLKVLEAKNKTQIANLRGMFSSLSTSLNGLLGSKNFGIRNVSADLLKQSKGLESYYGTRPSILEKTPEFYTPPKLPQNPIHETNNRLSEMTERLENLVGFGEHALQIMNGLQVASAEFLENFSTEAEKNSKAAKKAILVGIFAILFSVAQIGYTEFWRVPQDTAAMDAAVASVRSEIGDLQATFRTDLASFQAAQAATTEALAAAANSTGETNTALLKKIDQLLQQQRERDQALIDALEAVLSNERKSLE